MVWERSNGREQEYSKYEPRPKNSTIKSGVSPKIGTFVPLIKKSKTIN